MRALRRCLLLCTLGCGLSPAVLAQTTGDISGQVTVAGGSGLSEVNVAAFGPALQGSRVTTTDAAGRYRLTLLPPGLYNVTFTKQNFETVTKNEITVSLDRITTLDVVMQPTLQEQVKVIGEAPVDTTSTTLGTNLTERAIETLPTGRNYSSIVQVAPGTSSDANPENSQQAHITVYGSAGNENVFFIDGVNTTGVEYGFQGKELNYEFIKEIDVKTGGYEAEYGRSTGGIINVITKSGGNEFHGDLFGYHDSDSLQSSADEVVSTGGIVEGFTKEDYGADLGGYFVKDKIWFFGAFDRVSNTVSSQIPSGPQAGEVVDSDSRRNLAAFKVTFRLTDSQSLIATFFQDPRKDTGAINDAEHTLNGDPLTYGGRQDYGGRDYALRYQAVLGSKWIVAGQVARHDEQNSVGPATGAGDIVEFRDQDNNFFQTGGFGLIQEKDFKRDFVGASLTRFLGHHEFKFGAEYERQEAEVTKRYSGGQRVDFFTNPTDPLGPNPIIYVHRYWTTPTADVNDPLGPPISALFASPEHKNTTLYLQDRWAILSNLSINAGVRWDRQEIIDASGERQINLDSDYAPRLGLIWDPSKEHRSKVFASYGRFYEQLPMDLVIRSFSFERQPRIVNYSPTSTVRDLQAEDDAVVDDGIPPDPDTLPSAILGGFTEPSDPDLKGQYVREYILGWEREIAPNVALGVKGIRRDYGNVIEDFLCINDGTYCIGNPGRGIMTRIFDDPTYTQTFPAPRPKRRYRGIQVDVTKRFSHNWQGIASYIWSKLDGNYDGEYAPFTNVGADPNISAAYDYYEFFTDGVDLSRITNKGALSNDRRHQLKFSGIYITPIKLSIGLAGYIRSGTPVTRYGYSDDYGRYEFFLTERGKEGRTPYNYEADFHLGYPVEAGRYTFNFLLDVFNLLNAQQPILLDQRYNFVEGGPVNPEYLQPVLRTPPRSLRLGMRLSF